MLRTLPPKVKPHIKIIGSLARKALNISPQYLWMVTLPSGRAWFGRTVSDA